MNSSTAMDDSDDLIGRTEHVTAIGVELTAIVGGGTRAVFLTGERGLGKTGTLDFAAARLAEAGAVVVRGSCLDIGEVSWCPLLVGLKRWLIEPALAPDVDAGAVAGLVGVLENGEASRDSAGPLFHRVSEGLQKIATGRPLALVIDDLQWVDNATLRFLPFLLAGLGPDRVLVVAGVRLGDLEPEHRVARMVADLRRQSSVTVRELKPLTREETAALVAAIVGTPSPAEQANRLWDRSRGNPFLVQVLARAERDGVEGLPDELRDIALAQVAALPDDARAVVEAVAVSGTPVRYGRLREVTGLGVERLAAAVTAAHRARILADGPDGCHIHVGLYAEVIESALAPLDRVRLNRRYAEVLSAAGATAGQGRLAQHWLAAERPLEAWHCAVTAAERAQELHRYGEAYAYWTMAASIVEEIAEATVPVDERRRLWRSAAEAAHRAGDHEEALRFLDRLAATMAKPLPSEWYVMRARVLARAERPLDALAEYGRADQATGGCSEEERAKATAHLADLLVQLGRYDAAQQAAGWALAVTREHRDGAKTRALAASALGVSQAYLNDPVAGRATLGNALAEAEQDGTPSDILVVRLREAELLTGPMNELDSGIDAARAGAELAERSGLGRTHGARFSAVAASGLFRAGRWAEASRAVDAGMQYTPSGAAAVELFLARAKITLASGDLDAAERDLDAAEALTAGRGSVRHVLPLFTLRAGLALWRGAYDEAAEAVDTGLSRWVGQTGDLEMRAVLVWHGLRAAAELATDPDWAGFDLAGRVATLRAAADGLAADSEKAADPVRDSVNGYLVLCHAELSRASGQPSVDAWERAVGAWRERRQPYPEAYALLRLAEARYLTGPVRNATAAGQLREAYRMAMTLGARPLAAEIREFAGRVKVALEPPPRTPRAPRRARAVGDTMPGLTARETEVLGLAADGLTNEEIGSELFISPKTVGVHLTKVYQKLHVDNRLKASNLYGRWRADPNRDGGDTHRS